MSNRSLVLLIVAAFAVVPCAAGATARLASQAATGATKPVCGLEGEIGEGRGRIIARGADRGYRGEMSLPLADRPSVTLKVVSDFVPHQAAVDRITLEIGTPGGSSIRRLTGAFGEIEGASASVVRTDPPTPQDSRWFDALMAGQSLTATEGDASIPFTYGADRFEDDYNYLLDLLQLVAGWESAGLCVNRPGS